MINKKGNKNSVLIVSPLVLLLCNKHRLSTFANIVVVLYVFLNEISLNFH
jgi:hypothetical protein